MAELEKWSRKRNVQIQADSKSARDIGLAIKDLQADLERDKQKRLKDKADRKEYRAFLKLPDYTPRMEFWCDHCQIDFSGPAHKHWSHHHQIGTWQSFCPICERWLYRHISSKVMDPYYFKSEKVLNMRGINAQDLLQPGEYGFNTFYGDPFMKYYYQYQHRNEELFNKYSSMGLANKEVQQSTEDILDDDDFDM